MIIAWGLFIIGVIGSLVWLTELVPSLRTGNKHTGINFAFYFIMALSSAQYIWG